jgi:oligopeptide transport system substrate-binding protein
MNFLTFILLVLTFACTKSDHRTDTISVALEQEIATLDPANCFDTVCYVPVFQIYETLYEMDYLKRPYSLRPLLAEGLPDISRDHMKYTFKIKKNIKYHPNPFTPKDRTVKAQDIVDQIKRLAFLGTKSQGFWLFDGKVKGINEWRTNVGSDLDKLFSTPIPGVTALDEHTLVIELIRPYPQLLYAMALPFTSPVPAEAIKGYHNDLTLNTVGTGAYIVEKANLAQEVILKKNPDYITSAYPSEGDRYANEHKLLIDAGKKLPFIEHARMVVIKEAQTGWLNFLKKKIDMINLTKDHYQVALTPDGKLREEIAKDHILLQASPTLIYWWIAFNMKDPLFGKNLNLRQAIAHGVNIDKYIEIFTYNVAQKANSIYPPGVAGYSPSAELPYKYDLALAKEYLKKAGFPDGKGLPNLTFDVRGTDTRKRQMGEFVQQELRNLGINVDVRINSFPAFLEKSRKGQLQFWQGGWVLDYPDAENVLQLLTSKNHPPGPNSSQYSNPEYDALYEKVREMEDGYEKTELMAKMEKIVNKDLPWVMQYYSRNYILYHDYLENFRYSDIIYGNIKYLKIKKN